MRLMASHITTLRHEDNGFAKKNSETKKRSCYERLIWSLWVELRTFYQLGYTNINYPTALNEKKANFVRRDPSI